MAPLPFWWIRRGGSELGKNRSLISRGDHSSTPLQLRGIGTVPDSFQNCRLSCARMKVLVIEDELGLQEVIRSSLQKEGYVVESAFSVAEAQEKTALYEYDCILLDLMLPDGTGIELLRQLKQEGRVDNVIIISAKDSLDDKLEGLNLGADDYLSKPFHLAELTARLKAVLRRKMMDGKDALEVANLSLSINNREVKVNGTVVELNRKEFDILNYLLLNRNRLVTRTALAEHVWGDNIDQADDLDFIYYQIKNLRKRLKEAQADIEINSVYGMGYKLLAG